MEDGDDVGKTSKKRSRYFNKSSDDCQLKVDNSKLILNLLHNLYTKQELCDVFFEVGDRIYGAHKLILSSSSDVFQVMFSRPEWNEWQEKHIKLKELTMCENTFPVFLEYFYTGKILITHTNVLSILALADKYIVRGLSQRCLQYMCKHVPHAAFYSQLFSWFQYSLSCGHNEVAEKCQNYIKWNFEAIANTPDFSNFDSEMLLRILKDDDIIVYNEMVLYNCVFRWLELQTFKYSNASEPEVNLSGANLTHLIENVMSCIRFPMMTPRELAELLLSPLIKQHNNFFVDRMVIGMAYHSGQKEKLQEIRNTPDGNRLFTPRLYTSDTYSTLLSIENFKSLPNFHTSTFIFSSHMSSAEHESEKIQEWVVDIYPKGVWFKQCYLIIWQGTVVVPEEILSTVRLSLTCRDMSDFMKVKVAVLIYGLVGGIEHVMEVKEKIQYFGPNCPVMNINDLIPFNELNRLAVDSANERDSPYLVGPNRDQLKLNLVITPVKNF